jgi:DNA polymerase III epsilon subunit family exonuclease
MSFSLIQPLFSIPIAAIDVETTGVSPAYGHRIIEVGIARYENGVKVSEYQQLIDPRRRIDPVVVSLTGITQSMCDGQPTFVEQIPAMLRHLSGAMVLGHNIRFDFSFLLPEFHNSGEDLPQALGNPHVVDTLFMARRRFGRGGNGLGNLARRLGYQPTAAHRALPDAITTGAIFELLLGPVGGWNICLCDCLRQQGGPMGLVPRASSASLVADDNQG